MKAYNIEFQSKAIQVLFADTVEDAKKLLRHLEKQTGKYWGIDLETAKHPDFLKHPKAGLSPQLSSIRLLQLYGGKDKAYVFDLWKVPLTMLEKFLRSKTLIAHYAVFEINQLTHNGIADLDILCTKILGVITHCAEVSPFAGMDEPEDDKEDDRDIRRLSKGYSLASLTYQNFGLQIGKEYQTSNWNSPKLSKEQLAYAGLDAVLTFELAKIFIPKVKKHKMEEYFKLLTKAQHCISEMELTGAKVNSTAHRKVIALWEEELEKLRPGLESVFPGVNLNSPEQLGKWAKKRFSKRVLEHWPTTKTGKLSFNRAIVSEYLPEDKAIKKYLTYKKFSKLLSTYGENLEKKINPVTKRLHCGYTLGEARTGRLTSSNPNLQNLPRDKAVRDLFIAEKGKLLTVADFSQIELRSAGELSRDPVLLKAYRLNQDLHTEVVSSLMGVPQKKITPELRFLGKAINFGLAFGMQATKFRFYVKSNFGIELSEAECIKLVEGYKKKFTVFEDWKNKQRFLTQKRGYCYTPTGKVRALLQWECFTKAVNTPVQGAAAEVMLYSLIYVRKLLKKNTTTARLVNCVHDEVIIESSRKEASKVRKILEYGMVQGMKKVFPAASVKELTEACSGKTWSEAK